VTGAASAPGGYGEKCRARHFFANAEYNKMWSTTDRWTLDGAFKGFYSAFFSLRFFCKIRTRAASTPISAGHSTNANAAKYAPGFGHDTDHRDEGFFRVSAFNSRENASGCRPFSADCSGTIGSRVWPHWASAPSFALAFVVRSCLALRKAIPELCGQNLRCCFS
jgi:hypothetical protein